jgi:thymidylate kinase
LDLPVQVAVERRGVATDRIEDRGVDFQQQVALGMKRYGELCFKATVVVDADGDEDQVAARVAEAVRGVL